MTLSELILTMEAFCLMENIKYELLNNDFIRFETIPINLPKMVKENVIKHKQDNYYAILDVFSVNPHEWSNKI